MKILHRISATARIYAVVFLGVAALLGVAAYLGASAAGRVEARLTDGAERRLAAAFDLLERFAAAATAGEMTEPYARARAFAMIGAQPMEPGSALIAVDSDGVVQARALPDGAEAGVGDGPRLVRTVVFEPWGVTLQSSVAADTIMGELGVLRAEIVFPITAATMVFLGLSLLLAMSVLAPYRALRARMKTMAEGDLGGDIPHLDARDETGEAARALAALRRNIRRFREKSLENASSLERGIARLDAAVADAAEKELASVSVDGLDKRLGPLTASVDSALCAVEAAAQRRATARVEEFAATMRAEAERLSAAGAAEGAVEAAFARLLNAVAVARGEAAEAASSDAKTVDVATAADGAEALRRVQDLIARSDRLAFDAAVEAARAGKAGRGFSAVAKEARALSEAAAGAAKKTRLLADRAAELGARPQGGGGALAEIAAAGDAYRARVAERAETRPAMVLRAAAERLAALASTAETPFDAARRDAEDADDAEIEAEDAEGPEAAPFDRGASAATPLEEFVGADASDDVETDDPAGRRAVETMVEEADLAPSDTSARAALEEALDEEFAMLFDDELDDSLAPDGEKPAA